MAALDGIGRIDQLSDSRIVFEVCAQLIPVIAPRGNYHGILLTPFLIEGIELLLGKVISGCLIYFFEVSQEGFLILAGNVLQAVTDLMNDTALNLGPREGGLNCLSKALQIIDARDQDIFDATRPQV